MRKRYAINGASSFMGYNFAKSLVDKKDLDVICLLKGEGKKSYTGRYLERICELEKLNCELVFGIHSNEKILDFVTFSNLDYFHFHDCYTDNYRSDEFNLSIACQKNFHVLNDIYGLIAKKNSIDSVVISESYFQYPSDGKLKSVYSLSKFLNSKVHRFFCEKYSLRSNFFVIPNPVGPLENQKLNHKVFTSLIDGSEFKLASPFEKSINIFGAECASLLIENLFIGNKWKDYSIYPEMQNKDFVEDITTAFKLLCKDYASNDVFNEISRAKKSRKSLFNLEGELGVFRRSCLIEYMDWIRKEYLS